jgi:protein associated with RNAse G/E
MIPHDGHHVVTFFDELHPKKVEIYVDIVSDIRWQQLAAGSGYEVTLIDMDLDVIRTFDERGTWIDDEDEFAEHQVVMNYPDWAVSAAQSECNRIYSAVKDRVPPFDGTADDWFRKARP